MKVALVGFGTVGKSVYDMLEKAEGMTPGKVLMLPEFFTDPTFQTTDYNDILNDPETEAVVECITNAKAGYEYARAALNAGKHYVSSSKAMVAVYGAELNRLAREKGVAFLFGAACGGSMPILMALSQSRQMDEVLSVSGILNGTTNYMLDAMQRKGCTYEAALKTAQELGYAEADPTADVSGADSLRKIMLACAVSYGVLPSEGLNREGIESLTAEDVNHFAARGLVCRLIAKGGRNEDGSVYACVEPVLFGKNAPESSVLDNNNLAKSVCRYNGSLVLIGQGAGGDPTASNVLRDLVNIRAAYRHYLPADCKEGTAMNDACLSRYYVRVDGQDAGLFQAEEAEQDGSVCRIVTAAMPVKKMHQLAADIRANGRKVFFAAMAE
ncbi:MAG: homoserine dehydrogenase [Clostridia bacterium]|nr:homoserine dehydrogenase [Clostridia bacterium]